MSITLISTNVPKSGAVIENNALTNIRLPSTFQRLFSINNNQALCKKCNMTCKLLVRNILFHLTVCNGSLIDEDIQTKFKMKCLICNYSTGKISEWKTHLFQFDHITRSFDSSSSGFSYNCNMCETHFYGHYVSILNHECEPKHLSMLSIIMAYAYNMSKEDDQRMLYYCADCEHYSYNLADLHIADDCKAVKNVKVFVCKSCLITFYDSSCRIFTEHKIYFEHTMFWCLNGDREAPKTLTSTFPKLPSYMVKYFIKSTLLEQCCCIVCNDVSFMSYNYIYDHYIKCIASTRTSPIIDDDIPIQTVHCDLCMYRYSSPKKDVYQFWIDHVISIDHLTRTKTTMKNYKLYSYYCHDTKTIFYGTEYFVKRQILLSDKEIERSLFVPHLMAIVYQRADMYLLYDNLYCCGFCLSYTDTISENCDHKNIEKNMPMNCSTCLMEFNVKFNYKEHLLSSEHIILKYFKPDKMKEMKFLEYSLLTMKLYPINLNDSDNEVYVCKKVPLTFYSATHHEDVKSECKTKEETEKNCKLLNQLNAKVVCKKAVVTPDNLKLNTILNLIYKLHSVQPEKSAHINQLTIMFELMNEVSCSIQNPFHKSKWFFCVTCDIVFHDQSSWIKHDETSHRNRNSVFYCAVCYTFYINTTNNNNDYSDISKDINDHIKSVEHNVMVEFNEYMVKDEPMPIINNNVDSTMLINDKQKENVAIQILNDNDDSIIVPNYNQEVNVVNKKHNKTYKRNKNIYIEIEGVSDSFKKNNFSYLRELVKEKYGEFKQICNRNKSFIICFQNREQVETLVDDKTMLEEMYGFKIQVIGQNEEKCLSLKMTEMLSFWPKLCGEVFEKLESMELSQNLKIQSKIKNLCDSICIFNIPSNSVNIHIFGSRLYGLATKNSDVDLYFEIDNSFNGKIANNLNKQVSLVKIFAKQCLLNNEFTNVQEVHSARVPIVKFHHIPTKFDCDVSFKSGLSLFNSKLVRLYLSMNKTVKWLVCMIVKIWAPENNLKNNDMFTSYALVWLVLFYLMTKDLIPSLAEIVKNVSVYDHRIIEGWECVLAEWPGVHITQQRHKLLLDFFQYYANEENLENRVLCVSIGMSITKKRFFKKFSYLYNISPIQKSKFKAFKQRIGLNFEKHDGLALQDPFELSFNLTKLITRDKLTDFCELCDQSATILSRTQGII